MEEIKVTIGGNAQAQEVAIVKTSEIKNTRLLETTSEIESAVKKMKTDKTIKPKEYLDIAKIIEKGEKKIAKEYAKRLTQLEEIKIELVYLTQFADRMGYTLEVTEASEETEEVAEPVA